MIPPSGQRQARKSGQQRSTKSTQRERCRRPAGLASTKSSTVNQKKDAIGSNTVQLDPAPPTEASEDPAEIISSISRSLAPRHARLPKLANSAPLRQQQSAHRSYSLRFSGCVLRTSRNASMFSVGVSRTTACDGAKISPPPAPNSSNSSDFQRTSSTSP